MTRLEELIAFNDEVASLARAGVPIDLGLSQLSHDPDIAKARVNAALTQRVQNGMSLIDAMSVADQSFPPVYQSVVAAGLRCGHLPAALEAQSRYTQSLVDVRQSLRSSLVYPLLICVLAYLLFVGSCLFVPPDNYRLSADIGSGGDTLPYIVRMRESLPYWVAIPPVLLTVLLFIGSRLKSSRTMWFRWLPGISRVTADQRCASFAELLALLVEHEVPLHEGLRLAARASGDRKLTSAAQQMANVAEQGQSLTQDSDATNQFPPFLRWALTSPNEAQGRADTLRLAAQTYRCRADRHAKWLHVVMPMLTCVVLAGGVTLLYCLSVFVPLFRLINDLS